MIVGPVNIIERTELQRKDFVKRQVCSVHTIHCFPSFVIFKRCVRWQTSDADVLIEDYMAHTP